MDVDERSEVRFSILQATLALPFTTNFLGQIEAQFIQLSSCAVREISAYDKKCNCCKQITQFDGRRRKKITDQLTKLLTGGEEDGRVGHSQALLCIQFTYYAHRWAVYQSITPYTDYCYECSVVGLSVGNERGSWTTVERSRCRFTCTTRGQEPWLASWRSGQRSSSHERS